MPSADTHNLPVCTALVSPYKVRGAILNEAATSIFETQLTRQSALNDILATVCLMVNTIQRQNN